MSNGAEWRIIKDSEDMKRFTTEDTTKYQYPILYVRINEDSAILFQRDDALHMALALVETVERLYGIESTVTETA